MTFDMIFEAEIIAVLEAQMVSAAFAGAEPRVVPVIWAAKNREG